MSLLPLCRIFRLVFFRQRAQESPGARHLPNFAMENVMLTAAIRSLGVSCAIVAGLCLLLLSAAAAAATEKTLYSFASTSTDGYFPNGDLVADKQGNLYGTTAGGGLYTYGTVFELSPNTNGEWSETILYNFAGTPDGAYPSGGVIFDAEGNLYGVTSDGGENVDFFTSGGIVFKLSPPQPGSSQWSETIIFDFTAEDYAVGGNPAGKLVRDSAGNLYGVAGTGGGGDADFCGDTGCGDVFQLQPGAGGSWTFNDIHDFLVIPHSDGFGPQQVVMSPDGSLYGYSNYAGQWIKKISQYFAFDGASFRFTPSAKGQWPEQLLFISSEAGTTGQYPQGLTFGPDGFPILTMKDGGAFGDGAIIELSPAASGKPWNVNVLYSFTGGADGENATGTPLLDGEGNIYASTSGGGTNQCAAKTFGCGTMVKLSPNGDGTYTESTIYQFTEASGVSPTEGLLLHQGFLVGAARAGGSAAGSGGGTIFEIRP
jgi:uncharacterized repeat protein (TIGR03803 family)